MTSRWALRLCIFYSLINISNAKAQDIAAQNITLDGKPTDVFFQLGGSGRLRYENLFNAAAGRKYVGDYDSNVNDQMGVWLRLNKGEYFQSYINVLHVNSWGRQSSATGDSSPGQRDSFSGNNGLFVNQAWGKWKFSDTIHVEFGRLPLDWGYGAIFSKNTWQNHPFAFDSFLLGFDWEFLSLSVVGIKAEEMVPDPAVNEDKGKDPETNYYVLNFDFKNVMDYFKAINFSILQSMQDTGSKDGGATVVQRTSSQRFSLETVGMANSFGHKAAASYVSGSGTKQIMIDTELNYTFIEDYSFKLWFGFHRDSGDDDLTDGTNKTYDSFYYNIHDNAGRMDLLKWGNLKYYSFGLSFNILPHWILGTEYLTFEKASAIDKVNFGPQGVYLNSLYTGATPVLAFPADETNLGSELDIFSEYEFLSGLKALLIMSMYKPGEVFSKSVLKGTSTSAEMNDNIYSVMTQFEVRF